MSSGTYTIIGQFQSPTEAEHIATKIKDFLMDIMVEFNEANINSAYTIAREPTSTEQKIGQSLGFNWQETIDWLWLEVSNRQNPLKHIHTYDSYVFVSSPGDRTRQTGHQFQNIMEAFGGYILSNIYMGTTPDGEVVNQSIAYTLSCTTQSPAKTIELKHILQIHIDNERKFQRYEDDRPWMYFHSQFDEITGGLSVELVSQQHDRYLLEAHAWLKYIRSGEFEDLKRKSYLEWQTRVREENETIRTKFIKQNPKEREIIEQLRAAAIKLGGGIVNHAGKELELTINIVGGSWINIPTLIAWFEHHGCIVNYHFHKQAG
jgi:hypothetical protein